MRASDEGLSATCFHRASTFLKSHPNDLGALYFAAKSLSSMARYAEAKALIQRAMSLCPDDRKDILYNELGLLHRSCLEPLEAEASFRKALAVRSTSAGTHIFLGALLAVQGRLDDAEECHRTALTCPEGALDEAHLNLALVLRARERYSEALEHARAALALDPAYEAAASLIADLQNIAPTTSRS
ncbi:MAG TPA: tetratricopeptide repeat protein [Thermoanaerobaculia bacterium]|nr:tetratricopeptide repeat protein [Thermoanaerobaculia bacterium]